MFISNLKYRYLKPVFMILNRLFEFPTCTQKLSMYFKIGLNKDLKIKRQILV